MAVQTIERRQLRLLLEHQQDELDTSLAYAYLAEVAPSAEEELAFRSLSEDERSHARTFQDITGEELGPQDGKRRRVAFLRRMLGGNRFLKYLAEKEEESALRYEGLIGDFPQLEAVKRDELRHFDMLLGLMD